MGSQWRWLLLLLLFNGDGNFNLQGSVTAWGVRSATAPFTQGSMPNSPGTSSATSAPANSGRACVSGASCSTPSDTTVRSTFDFQNRTPSAPPPTASPTNRSTPGSTEQPAHVHGPQKRELDTTVITPSKGTPPPSMATSPEMPKENHTTSGIAPLASNTTVNTEEPSVSTDSETVTGTTASVVVNTACRGTASSGPTRSTVSEESHTTPAPTTLTRSKGMKESLPTTTSAEAAAVSSAPLGATRTGSQEGETTAASLVQTTVFPGKNMNPTPLRSTLSQTRHPTVAYTHSHPEESIPRADTTMTQSPETTALHSTVFLPSTSETTTSSAMAGVSQASTRDKQSSGPGAGSCALDEYPASGEGCRCSDDYYDHADLSNVSVALHCQPQEIEMVLSSCFLKTQHWVLRKGALSGCPNVSRIEQGRRGQAFLVSKEEDTCGLHLSTNSSHALYSLEVQFLHLSYFNLTTLNFSCAYPLMVNVSHSHPVVSFPYSTIHVPGAGETIVTLGLFTDPQLSSPLQNGTAPLGMPLYVVLRATSSEPERFVLVVNEVFASTDLSRMGAARTTYHFVTKSCPVSNRLLAGLPGNGASLTVTLAFKLYHFVSSDLFYLHGQVMLCDKQGRHRCQLTCSQKGPTARNEVWESGAQEGMGVGDGWMVFGPIRISEFNGSSSRTPAGAWVAIFLLMVVDWLLG